MRLGLEIATPDDAREMLELKGVEHVNFRGAALGPLKKMDGQVTDELSKDLSRTSAVVAPQHIAA